MGRRSDTCAWLVGRSGTSAQKIQKSFILAPRHGIITPARRFRCACVAGADGVEAPSLLPSQATFARIAARSEPLRQRTSQVASLQAMIRHANGNIMKTNAFAWPSLLLALE